MRSVHEKAEVEEEEKENQVSELKKGVVNICDMKTKLVDMKPNPEGARKERRSTQCNELGAENLEFVVKDLELTTQ
jgi:hypothetical protein